MNIEFINKALAQHPAGKQDIVIQQQYGFGVFNTLGDLTNILLPLAFSIAGMMIVFYFLIAAFEMITSQGDKAHIVSARAKIYHSLIGIILLLLLYLVVRFILFDVLKLTSFNFI